MRQRAMIIILGVLLVAVLFGAISQIAGSKNPHDGGTETKSADPTGDSLSSDGSSETNIREFQDLPGEVEKEEDPYAALGIPPDFAFGSYPKASADDPSPSTCSLVRGESCIIPFQGRYRLVSAPQAILRLAAFEDQSAEPIAVKDIPIKRTAARFFDTLAYTPSSEASTVQFRVMLLSVEGSIIFERQPPEPHLPLKG